MLNKTRTFLALSLLVCATGCSALKQNAIDAGKEIAAAAGPIIIEKSTEAAAKATAAQVAADDNLTAQEKADITTTLYGAGGATLASLLAALRMWGLARGKKAALGVVVKAVDKLPPEIAKQVKDQVTALGGSSAAIKKTITAVKS